MQPTWDGLGPEHGFEYDSFESQKAPQATEKENDFLIKSGEIFSCKMGS